jgi:uncharacterized membrane protein YedE/YeeE
MTVDWNSFTPSAALAGGALIGLAAALFLLMNGRIAGISGIVAGLLRPAARDWQWRVAFIAGMALAPLVARLGAMPKIEIAAAPTTLIFAGFLVGIGTRYGSGCTSGHGVCGVSRLSLRSLVATVAFMVTGFATVYIVRHGLGR